jgi:tetratricopeptide (TPR) repeat protein
MRPILLLVLCLSLPALAQRAEVKKFLNSATTFYENLEYEKALKQLKKAKAKISGPDDESKIAILEGVVLADMGRDERALAAFKTGFSIDLEARLPVDVSPKVQAIADRARANVRKLLAPALEVQKEEAQRLALEEKRVALEEKRRSEEAARAVAAVDRSAEPGPAAVRAADATPPPEAVQPAPSLVRKLSWIPAAIGLASAGVATYFLVSAGAKDTALREGTIPVETAQAYRSSGPVDANVGYAFIGVGAVGLAAAVTMFAAGGAAGGAQIAVAPIREGAFVSISVPVDLGVIR